MSLPMPPADTAGLADFPARIWKAQQPLGRIHRQEFGSMYFGTDQDGRWNPPRPGVDWGTCYLSTHSTGAALEVFGRFQLLPQSEIDRRVLATVYLGSDVRLADMTHASVMGRFGLTAEISAGAARASYACTQRWAGQLQAAGFGGVYYAARHDPTLGSRSVALFGKAMDRRLDDAASEWMEDVTTTTKPIPPELIDELRETYGFTILASATPL